MVLPKRTRKPPSGSKIPVLQIDALMKCLEEEKIKPLNAYRLLRWVLKNPTSSDWDEVPYEDLELPHRMIEVMKKNFVFKSSKISERLDSNDGTTTKLLIELHDGEEVEAVVMRHEKRATLCVSSQVGCKMGCTFCATGTMGLRGNLSSGEILEQLLHAGTVEKMRNIVFMGMGEPLSNYDSVLLSLKAMTDVQLWSLKHGRITVSTVGVIANMHKLTRDMPNISLALSLHAPTQEIREIIVPTAKAHPLPDLLHALDQHLAQCKTKTKGAVAGMIEYILIAGVNDSSKCAQLLGELLKERNVMLNLIPYNDTSSTINADFKPPDKESVDNFQSIIVSHGIICRVRREMGADIAGACGQLALTKKPENQGMGDIEDYGGASKTKNKIKEKGRVVKTKQSSKQSCSELKNDLPINLSSSVDDNEKNSNKKSVVNESVNPRQNKEHQKEATSALSSIPPFRSTQAMMLFGLTLIAAAVLCIKRPLSKRIFARW